MGNLASMAAMMALPWALIGASDDASYWYAIIWDILLSLHLISLLIRRDSQLLELICLLTGSDTIGKSFDSNAVNLHVALCFFERVGDFWSVATWGVSK